jgi:nucleotide-binding universal stress UspA family protein
MDTSRVTMSGEPGSFELGTDGPTSILVGVDGSPTSMRAAAYAAGLARRQRARLVVVYVGKVGGMPAAAALAAGAVDETIDEIGADLRRQVAEASRDRGVDAVFMAVRGDPYNEIKRIAMELRVDAVVVGASATAGHRFVGSLAVRLVKAGRWPVTVVP